MKVCDIRRKEESDGGGADLRLSLDEWKVTVRPWASLHVTHVHTHRSGENLPRRNTGGASLLNPFEMECVVQKGDVTLVTSVMSYSRSAGPHVLDSCLAQEGSVK